MANLDHRFDQDGRMLVLQADIANGWRNERRASNVKKGHQSVKLKTYCFSEVLRAEWQGGTIRAQISVFPRPGGVTPEWESPPLLKIESRAQKQLFENTDGTLSLVDDCITIEAHDGLIAASIVLLDEDGQRPRALLLSGSGDQQFERILKPYASVEIQVRLTFQPGRKAPPVYRSFWNAFLPGGLPMTNRRKF
jgi:hypothetical protein